MADSKQGIFGIDLGTTYSVVAYIDASGRPAVTRNLLGVETTPSVVYFESETNVVVGQTAKNATTGADRVVSLIKREMGNRDYHLEFFGKEYNPSSISGLILKALAEEAGQDSRREVHDVVITVPAYFGMLEKDATRNAGEIAGLNVTGIVPEPVAAALHYGMSDVVGQKTVLIYDLGGGTFDVSVIRISDRRIEVLVVGGNHKLGGADWDEKLLAAVVNDAVSQLGDESLRDDATMIAELRSRVETLKRALSAQVSKSMPVRFGGGVANVTVTREQFEAMTGELLEETIRITERTLEEAEEKYPGVRQQIGEVLLVGGSSYMPAVARAITEKFDWEPKLNEPNLAVAKGAALYAVGRSVFADDTDRTSSSVPESVTEERIEEVSRLTGIAPQQLKDLAQVAVVNVLPKAVGVKMIDTSKPGWEQDPASAAYIEHLVAANTQLPVSASCNAATLWARQETLEVEIWEQGGDVATRDLSGNVPVTTGVGRIEKLGPHALPAGSPVRIEMDVSEEGLVTLKASEPTSGQALEIKARISVMAPQEVEEAKAVVRGITVGT